METNELKQAHCYGRGPGGDEKQFEIRCRRRVGIHPEQKGRVGELLMIPQRLVQVTSTNI